MLESRIDDNILLLFEGVVLWLCFSRFQEREDFFFFSALSILFTIDSTALFFSTKSKEVAIEREKSISSVLS